MRAIAIIAGLAVAAVAVVVLWPRSERHAATSPCGPVDISPAAVGVAIAATTTLCLINEQRAARGLPPLAGDAVLAQAAREHSEDMVRRGYFEHTAPDGRTVQDRIRASGWAAGGSASTGENIGWGVNAQATPAAVVAKWMASPPHRADILRPAFTAIGIGIALGVPTVPGRAGGDGATYTTDFGGVVDPSLPSG